MAKDVVKGMAKDLVGGTMNLYDENHRIIAPIYKDLQQNI